MEIIECGNKNISALVSGVKYRVYPITKIIKIEYNKLYVETFGIEEGLNIEAKVENSDNYIVIATVRYDKEEQNVVFEPIDFRITDSLKEDTDWAVIQEFCNCVDFAKQVMEDIFEKEME